MFFFAYIDSIKTFSIVVLSIVLSVWHVFSERFWLVPASGPSVLLSAFLERFQSTCLLAQQLPAMKPEQLKSMVKYWHLLYVLCLFGPCTDLLPSKMVTSCLETMFRCLTLLPTVFFFSLQSLTEDVVSSVLQMIDEEQKRKGASQLSEPLAVQVAACIVSLCGWAAR